MTRQRTPPIEDAIARVTHACAWLLLLLLPTCMGGAAVVVQGTHDPHVHATPADRPPKVPTVRPSDRPSPDGSH